MVSPEREVGSEQSTLVDILLSLRNVPPVLRLGGRGRLHAERLAFQTFSNEIKVKRGTCPHNSL